MVSKASKKTLLVHRVERTVLKKYDVVLVALNIGDTVEYDAAIGLPFYASIVPVVTRPEGGAVNPSIVNGMYLVSNLEADSLCVPLHDGPYSTLHDEDEELGDIGEDILLYETDLSKLVHMDVVVVVFKDGAKDVGIMMDNGSVREIVNMLKPSRVMKKRNVKHVFFVKNVKDYLVGIYEEVKNEAENVEGE